MGVKTGAKRSKWFKDRCESGCQICGVKLPGINNGLEFSHLVSKKDGGSDRMINCLALCPNCAYSFDFILKPALYNTLTEIKNGKVPESWKYAEGRLKPDDSD